MIEAVRLGANPVWRDDGATRALLCGSLATGQAGPGIDVGLLVLDVERLADWHLGRDLEQA